MKPWGLGSALIGALLFVPISHAIAAREVVAFRNDLPGEFQLVRVQYVVDGALRYDAPRPADLALSSDQRHVVTVIASYRLRDPIFSYMNGYNVEVRSTHELAPMAGRDARVVAVAADRGGVTTPVEKRPVIGWEERLR